MSLHCDVAVCGAGIAGIAAALAAARAGRQVLLIEKQTILGGLATSGLIYVSLPLRGDNGAVVTSGLPEERRLASAEYGPFELPRRYTSGGGDHCDGRYACRFSPAGPGISSGCCGDAGAFPRRRA